MMNTMFVATVGKGDMGDIRLALAKSIRESNPSFLLLFATKETYENAQDICRALGYSEENSRIHYLSAPKEDVESLYREMLDVVSQMLREKGVEPPAVTADFTTGMKTMSSALVIAALKLGLGRVKYIVAKRDEAGRICSGQERTFVFEPLGFRASFMLDTAIALMRQYQFKAVRQLLEPLAESLLNSTEKANRACLLNLANAYSKWDLFQHIQFKNIYDKAAFGQTTGLEEFRATPDTVSAVMAIGQKSEKNELCDLTIVDIINNARRRIEEGKFDDAVARLYRACEMLAQLTLFSEHNLRADDIDLNRVPEKSRKRLREYQNKENKVQIGLVQCYRLLQELGDQFGDTFFENKDLEKLLICRNQSILAHGIKPMMDKAEGFLSVTEGLAKSVISNYDTKSALLRFPWSR